MRNPIFKDTLREIKNSKGRFLSILGIVLIGVAFFSGVWATAPDMKHSGDKYFDDYNLMDYRILSNFGLTEDDIKAINKIEGVQAVYPAFSQDFIASNTEENYVLKVSSFNLTDIDSLSKSYMNRFVFVEGRMPENNHEMVVEKVAVMQNGLKVGDKIKLSTGTKDPVEDYLNVSEYEIVGLINSPYYLSYEKGASAIGGGKINMYAYISEDNFLSDYYTEAFITIKGASEYNSYSQAYFDYLKPFTIELESIGYNQSAARSDDIREEAYAKLDDAKKEYEEAKDTYEREIDVASSKIEIAKQDIILGKANIQSSELVLTSQIASAKQQITMLKQTVASLQSQYDIYKKQFETANAGAITQRDKLVNDKQLLESTLNQKKILAQPIYNELNVLENEITTLSNEINVLNENNNVLTAENVLLNQQLLLITDITSIEYIEINSKIAVNEQTIVTNNNEIQSKNIDISVKENRKTTLNNDPLIIEITSLGNQINQLNTQIDLINQGLSSSETAMIALKRQIDKMNDEIIKAEVTLIEQETKGKAQIAEGKAKIVSGEAELNEGIIKFEEEKQNGIAKLEDGLDEITKAENDISLIDDAKWFVLDRNSHYSYVDFRGAAERMESIAVVFPVFFFLVAALVCLTTMTRLIDEQRLQIGTLKALGYNTRTISFKYLFYAISASLIGGILGLIIGMTLFPWIIFNAWKLMYVLPDISLTIQWGLVAVTLISSVLVTAVATLLACFKELVASPSSLMRPKAPKIGKKTMIERVGFVWNNLSFTLKVTFRNIFRYKKRMLMTIIGIAGCTGLLLAGFGIKDSISDIAEIQFKEVFKYSGMVRYEDGIEESAKIDVLKSLSNEAHVNNVLDVSISNAVVNFDANQKDINLVVTNNPKTFTEFYSLRTRVSHEEAYLSNTGAIITEKIANDYGIEIGSFISVTNEDNITKSLKVDAIIENYVDHYIYLTSGYYKEVFGVKSSINTLLFKIDDIQYEKTVAASMLADENVMSVNYHSSFYETFMDMIESLNIIVIVLVISAGALAFIVLYNLTNVNISERQREIATLKVLGFFPKEIKRYVYYENILLTILGSLVGLLVGFGLHLLVMVVVEMDDLMFGRNVAFLSYLISFALTIVFAMLVNWAMQSKLRKIEMVESLKSIE